MTFVAITALIFSTIPMGCAHNSLNSRSLDATIYLTILTVNVLNLGWPTVKYSKRIATRLSFLRTATKAELRSTITERSFSPKSGIGSLSVKIMPYCAKSFFKISSFIA